MNAIIKLYTGGCLGFPNDFKDSLYLKEGNKIFQNLDSKTDTNTIRSVYGIFTVLVKINSIFENSNRIKEKKSNV